MIEHMTVEGRPATVVYLKRDFTPVESKNAEMVKILFNDGDVRIAYPVKELPK